MSKIIATAERIRPPGEIPVLRKEEIERPRVTWGDRIRRVFGFIGRRRRIIREDLRDLTQSHSSFGPEIAEVLVRNRNFGSPTEEHERHLKEDLTAYLRNERTHFEQRAKQFEDNQTVAEHYRTLAGWMYPGNRSIAKSAIQSDIDGPYSKIVEALAHSGVPGWRVVAPRLTRDMLLTHAPQVSSKIYDVLTANDTIKRHLTKIQEISGILAQEDPVETGKKQASTHGGH